MKSGMRIVLVALLAVSTVGCGTVASLAFDWVNEMTGDGEGEETRGVIKSVSGRGVCDLVVGVLMRAPDDRHWIKDVEMKASGQMCSELQAQLGSSGKFREGIGGEGVEVLEFRAKGAPSAAYIEAEKRGGGE